MENNIHEGHRNRLRELYNNTSFDAMEQHQILELLLFYAIPKKDTNPIAHRLLNFFGSFQKVLDAPVHELVKIYGVGTSVASFLKEVREMIVFYENFTTPNNHMTGYIKWCDYLNEKLKDIDRESLFIVVVDGKLNILSFKEIDIDLLGDRFKLYSEIIDILHILRAYRFALVKNKPYTNALATSKDQKEISILESKFKTIDIEFIDFFIRGKDDKIISAMYVN